LKAAYYDILEVAKTQAEIIADYITSKAA